MDLSLFNNSAIYGNNTTQGTVVAGNMSVNIRQNMQAEQDNTFLSDFRSHLQSENNS